MFPFHYCGCLHSEVLVVWFCSCCLGIFLALVSERRFYTSLFLWGNGAGWLSGLISTLCHCNCFSNWKCWLAVCIIRRAVGAGLCWGLAGRISPMLWEPPCNTAAKATGNSIVALQVDGNVQPFPSQCEQTDSNSQELGPNYISLLGDHLNL